MKKWLKSPWGISIGTAIFTFALTVIYDCVKNKPILSTIHTFIQTTGKFIVQFFNIELKVWWVALGVLAITLVMYIMSKVITAAEKSEPEFCQYNDGHFRHWRWTWDWQFNYNKGLWNIRHLVAHCPKCDTPMVDHSNCFRGVRFQCPRCNFQAEDNECDQAYEVEQVIFDNIERQRQKARNSQ